MTRPQPVPELWRPDVRLLLVGINPGTTSAATGFHFAGPGNRFWPALHMAGLTPRILAPAEQHELLDHGIGVANLVARGSPRATDVGADELREGGRLLLQRVARWRDEGVAPAVVAVLGLGAFRTAFRRPKAARGRVEPPDGIEPPRWWLLSNPSGLNASTTVEDHAAGLRSAARDAGLP